MKTLSVALLALAVAAPAAMAQTTTTPTAPPPATPMATTTGGSLQYYNRQAGEIRASKLVGTKVVNAANETIGDINEVILNGDGRVAALVVGVGGFLGMGEHDVALDFKSVRIETDNSAMTNSGATTVRVNATKDQLKAAPQWSWTGGTTGSGTTK